MACPITISKFVGTVSLGLLTGLSYAQSAVTVPTLLELPTASSASQALVHLQHSTLKISYILSAVGSTTLLFAYSLSSSARKHPFLLYTATLSVLSTVGVEMVYKGYEGAFQSLKTKLNKQSQISQSDINGESVQRDMNQEQKVLALRAGLAGVGFMMAVVGLWGDRPVPRAAVVAIR